MMTIEIVQLYSDDVSGSASPVRTYGIRRRTLFGYKYLDFDSVTDDGTDFILGTVPDWHNDISIPTWHKKNSQYFSDCFVRDINTVNNIYQIIIKNQQLPKFKWLTGDEVKALWTDDLAKKDKIQTEQL